jgi:dsDNA-binding SOS-regulon protein
MSAESMVESYPALTLEQVHGALAFYLANQKEIDAYLVEGQRAAEAQHRQSKQTNAELIAKLRRARDASQVPG